MKPLFLFLLINVLMNNAYAQFQTNSLAVALDNTTVNPFTSNIPWQVSTSNFIANGSSAGSGDVQDDEFSFMTVPVTLNTTGTISFFWSVSSEEEFDRLVFSVLDDATQEIISQEQITGEIPFELFEMELPAGSYLLNWIYVKDASITEGEDAGFVDLLTIPSEPDPVDPPTTGNTGGSSSAASLSAIITILLLSED